MVHKLDDRKVTKAENPELEGITLNVYWYVVKEGKPVGPREAMKGAHLSSPSVAYRHLQKLEDLGYLQKNEYGEYFVKRKANLQGYIWVGNRIVSKMMLYTFTFLAILILETIVLAIHYEVETNEFKIFFALLITITAIAMGLFFAEAMMQRRKANQFSKTE